MTFAGGFARPGAADAFCRSRRIVTSFAMLFRCKSFRLRFF